MIVQILAPTPSNDLFTKIKHSWPQNIPPRLLQPLSYMETPGVTADHMSSVGHRNLESFSLKIWLKKLMLLAKSVCFPCFWPFAVVFPLKLTLCYHIRFPSTSWGPIHIKKGYNLAPIALLFDSTILISQRLAFSCIYLLIRLFLFALFLPHLDAKFVSLTHLGLTLNSTSRFTRRIFLVGDPCGET